MFASKPNVVVSTLIVSLAYCISALAQTSQIASPSWVLKPAINSLPNWYEVRGGAWRVPKNMVEEMDLRIRDEMGSAPVEFNKYVIQYQGESSGASHSIRLSGACDTLGKNEREFSEKFHTVYDGGKCFFDAMYEPEKKQFSYFAYHGR